MGRWGDGEMGQRWEKKALESKLRVRVWALGSGWGTRGIAEGQVEMNRAGSGIEAAFPGVD